MAVKAFREAYMIGEYLDADDYCDPDARSLRYGILWGFYENTAYRDVHTWAASFRAKYALYRYTRNIYNPAYRLGEFWKTTLWGGQLDPDAGDGKATPSALPIETENEALRPAIAALWQASNWSVKKDIAVLWGAVMGDVVLRVTDDTERGKAYVELVHPALLYSVERDPFGHVKAYEIRETRPHPKHPTQSVTYAETAERGDGQDVVYRTYLNGKPYAWNGGAAEWVEPYGFIPLVTIQHNDVGLDWGWAELFPLLSKVREIDDQASILGDQIRKTQNSGWFFSGVAKPKTTPTSTLTTDTTTGNPAKPEAGREDVPALYSADPSARAIPLVAPLDIADTSAHILSILKNIEEDYPELSFEKLRLTGAASGMALRVARQPAEAKVMQRRANYDAALVRVHQMAVAIGGMRGYDGYAGFGLESYAAGALEHSIGKRAVFAVDPLDDLEEDKAFWTAAEQAGKAGVPLSVYLARAGWDEDEIAALEAAPETQQKRRMQEAATLGFGAMRVDKEG